MKERIKNRWMWVAALLTLLAITLLPGMPEAVVRGDSANAEATATASALMVPATAEPVTEEQEMAFALEDQIIQVYDTASPAVANITSRSYVTYRFMGTVPEEGTGSGFVYDTEGHILTNYHVIENADELLVTLASGQVYEATVVGSDPTNDLAVLHIDAGADLPDPLPLGDSDDLRVGQFVVAIGNPYGLDQTLTTGVVSALGRVIESPEDNRFIGEAIQTDAAINPGNSGGPLLNLEGEVIGINSQIISPSGASSGIGFAVSVNTVRRVVPELIANGYYAHAWLGAEMTTLSPTLAEMLREAGLDPSADLGILVLNVVSGGPAAEAGVHGASQWLRVGPRYQLPAGGDIITAIDGQSVEDVESLTLYLEMEKRVGDTVELTLTRDGQEITVSVTLGEQPQP
jgi:S1-C subfamily serine protease